MGTQKNPGKPIRLGENVLDGLSPHRPGDIYNGGVHTHRFWIRKTLIMCYHDRWRGFFSCYSGIWVDIFFATERG